jgi:exodeoxyribonuclease V beta subunit
MSYPAFDTARTPLQTGVTLLEASAGTGKTYAIEGLYLRFVAETGVPVPEILVCTFTNAATRELSTRIRERILAALSGGDPVLAAAEEALGRDLVRRRLATAAASFDCARISTIHGFCSRVLAEHAFESGTGFGTALAENPGELSRTATADFARRLTLRAPKTCLALRLCGRDVAEILAEALRLRGADAEMPLYPAVPAPDVEACDALLEARLKAVAEEWRLSAEAVTAFLRDGKRANLALRSEAGTILRGMESLAVGGVPEECAFEAIRLLTPESVVSNTNRRSKEGAPQTPLFALCGEVMRFLDRFLTGILGGFLSESGALLAGLRARSGSLDFDDLILLTAQALRGEGPGSLRSLLKMRLRVGLVDEFQDTDLLQWEIFRTLFDDSAHSLFMIGDPKQAIYRFRGADVDAYLRAASEAPRRYGLGVNWRSDGPLVRAVNTLFSATEAPFGAGIAFSPVESGGKTKPEKAFAPGGLPPEPMRFVLRGEGGVLPTSAWMTARLASDVCECLASGATIGPRPVAGGDLAVIVRRHAQAQEVVRALAVAGVRAVEESDASVFDSDEAKALLDLLKVAESPSDAGGLRRVLAGDIFRCSAREILDSDGANDSGAALLEFMRVLADAGFAAAFRRLERRTSLRARLLATEGGERSLTNLLHLEELLSEAEREEKLGAQGLCRWLALRIADPQSRPREGDELRLESDGGAVRVITCHKSKGLEFPIVFAPFFGGRGLAHRGRFAVRRGGERPELHFAADGALSPEVVAEETAEILREETRLLYVLLTRARSRCTVYLAEDALAEGTFGGSLRAVLGAQDFAGTAASLEACAAATGAISVRREGDPAEAPRLLQEGVLPELSFRPFAGKIAFSPFVTSFTGLCAGGEGEAPDRADSPHAAPVAPEEALSGIAAFPRGPEVGTFFHSSLEKMNFAEPSGWESVIRLGLAAAGLDGADPAIALDCLSSVLETPLAPEGPLLLGSPEEDLRREEEFYFPARGVDFGKMADAFAAEGGLLADFAGRLRRMPPREVEGYLKGYIDLIFRSQGRFHILDWKSNWLGPSSADYAREALHRAMVESAYYLQGALYALAFKKCMAFRAPQWNYGRDFGALYYVFLRGVERGRPGSGVLSFRPSEQLLDGLAEALGSEGRPQ